MNTAPRLLSWLALGLVALSRATAAETPFEPWRTSRDPVAKLYQRICQGTLKMDTSRPQAFLQQMLHELDVPVASQVMVFSKTSLQNALITPQTPRVIYFSEEAYIGWCQGGIFELIGVDPVQGPQFYVMTFPYQKGEKVELLTSDNCFNCHEGSRTNGVKGMLVRSVYTAEDGQPILSEGSFLSGHESPLSERWGGWYVTGHHGKETHMGNVIAHETPHGITLDRARGANITSLEALVSTTAYLANTSDIVALMVLEHQCTMHNLITDAGKSTREAMARQRDLQKAFGEPITDVPQGSAASVIRSHAEKLVKHMLFCEEYPLKNGGVEGGAAFQEAFRRNRAETKEGRSLKDFQLLTRLFKHRCSYMIYSKSFDALPAQVKTEFYTQLHRVLTDTDPHEAFPHLSASERANILEIVLETKADLPAG
ncbi:MAG: hypothetical protein ACOYMN_14270, partial [Roseimicrobium sp.]